MPTILKVAVAVPIRLVFDYLPPAEVDIDDLCPGQRILVPFGPRNRTGFLLGIEQDAEIDTSRLKKVTSIIDKRPLQSEEDLKLLVWASRYYHHPIGEVIAVAWPTLLRKGKAAEMTLDTRLALAAPEEIVRSRLAGNAHRQKTLVDLLAAHPEGVLKTRLNQLEWNWRGTARNLLKRNLIKTLAGGSARPCEFVVTGPRFDLNPEQEKAVKAIRAELDSFRIFLLEGITGSGKTEVYFRIIQSVLESGRQAMILLPEISLTPQVEARFKARFNSPIALFHSGLSEQRRKNSWLQCAKGQAPILLGTRSAVFTPLKAPGLIILDEEHDTSFKQQEGFRFSARDIALKRAQQLNIPVILGSATPSLESLHNAERGQYRHLTLSVRAGDARPPSIQVLDVRKQPLTEGLSPQLIKAIKTTLAGNQQVLLFINRRGYAPRLICHSCGWVAQCQRCDTSLVIHSRRGILQCHHCGHQRRIPATCENCSCDDLRPLGLGTERIEQILEKIFPESTISRLDRDSTRRKGSLERTLEDVRTGKTDILIGTQMLAKGHHFPNVTLAGILDSDSGLFSTDFRTTEKLAQLLIQVAGRAGRTKSRGTVIIQTRHPEHPMLVSLISGGYPRFANDALAERKLVGLPPFTFQALFRAESTDPEHPLTFLSHLRQSAEVAADREVEILGPVPAPMARRAGHYRYQLLLQANQRSTLHRQVSHLLSTIEKIPGQRRVKWSIDIDPVDLF
ncbi:MAG: primosomal protein N' [Pseudomonadota bacterium]|nr:primosomal protein N' [Pseudomonadota bacterium]